MTIEQLLRDLRFSFRKLARDPGIAVVAVLALALGIGLTTGMFSIVYGALYRGLPFPDAEEIMHLERTNLSAGIESMEVTVHDYVDWRAQQRSFEDLAAFYQGTINVRGTERAERYEGAFMSAGGLDMLGVAPVRGRLFRTDDDAPGAPRVAIIGYRMWQDRFGGEADVVGRTVRANGEPTEIVGVMPEGFRFPVTADLWVPLAMSPLDLERGEGQTLEVFGRLGDGVTAEEAQAELAGIAQRLAAEYPESNDGVGVLIKPYTREFVGDENYVLGFTMLGAVFFVLLIACANVANLLLSRALVRSREVGIRTAMGASRWRVLFQFLAEAFALAAAGGVLGLGLAWLVVGWFDAQLAQTGPPFWMDIRIDGLSLLFVLAVTAVATLMAGVFPAWQAANADVNTVLKDESRGASSFRLGRLSRGLVIAEIALSMALLVAAGLMTRSIINVNTVDFAFETETVFTARVGLPEASYPDEAAQLRFFEELDERLAALPGATAATVATQAPGFWAGRWWFAREGVVYEDEQSYPAAQRAAVSPGYFETFGVTPVQGRVIQAQDRPGSLPVAVVNESFARRYFEGESPIGRRIRLGRSDSENPWLTIVGVVPDMHAGGLQNGYPEGLYVPFAQMPARFATLAVHVAGGEAGALAAQVRDVVQAVDTDIPIYWPGTLASRIADENWMWGLFGSMFAALGVLALILAAIGLYAVMAFAVSHRTREVGVRMALGAASRDVLTLVLRRGLGQLAVGIAIGLAMAAGLAQLLTDFLFQVDPRDPAVFAGIVVVLLTTGLLACLVPARRAARVDPMEALRYE